MEGMPRLPMISFFLKEPYKHTSFEVFIKKNIAEHFSEDPDSFEKEIKMLESLRAAAVRPGLDVDGLTRMKRYFYQFHALTTRFSALRERQVEDLVFEWCEVQSSGGHKYRDPTYEMAAIMYNIGAVHSSLGAADPRLTADGMKMSCTHFQCAAGAFDYLREHLTQYGGSDINRGMTQFYATICLAQAQECILEKSMVDNRKGIITAKVAAQVAEYHKLARKYLETALKNGEFPSEHVGEFRIKQWIDHVDLKTPLFDAISLLFRGMYAEEQQRMGERITFYQAAETRLKEAEKCSKRLSGDEKKTAAECMSFVTDVITGKLTNAKKENEFIYHEKVPSLESLPEINGASLVKGIPVDFKDREVVGVDLFHRLVPMEAHERSSIYSSKKDELLRQALQKVDKKDEELMVFMSSLQLEQLQIVSPMLDKKSPKVQVSQELVDCIASIHARPDAVTRLKALSSHLSNASVDLQDSLDILETMLKSEDDSEREFVSLNAGRRPPSMITTELRREYARYREAHGRAADSDAALQRAISAHVPPLELLAAGLEAVQLSLPSPRAALRQPDAADAVRRLTLVANKVEEMKKQRATLVSSLREAVSKDDITKKLVTCPSDGVDTLIEKHLAKHKKQAALIEQNLSAQDNILRALTEANAGYAPTRQLVGDTLAQLQAGVAELMTSYTALDQLLEKGQQGLQFYSGLQESVRKLSSRARGVCKVQEEERSSSVKSSNPSAAAATSLPSTTFPKLSDYLASGYRPGGGKSDSPVPRVRPSPVGSEHVDPACCTASAPSLPPVTVVPQPSVASRPPASLQWHRPGVVAEPYLNWYGGGGYTGWTLHSTMSRPGPAPGPPLTPGTPPPQVPRAPQAPLPAIPRPPRTHQPHEFLPSGLQQQWCPAPTGPPQYVASGQRLPFSQQQPSASTGSPVYQLYPGSVRSSAPQVQQLAQHQSAITAAQQPAAAQFAQYQPTANGYRQQYYSTASVQYPPANQQQQQYQQYTTSSSQQAVATAAADAQQYTAAAAAASGEQQYNTNTVSAGGQQYPSAGSAVNISVQQYHTVGSTASIGAQQYHTVGSTASIGAQQYPSAGSTASIGAQQYPSAGSTASIGAQQYHTVGSTASIGAQQYHTDESTANFSGQQSPASVNASSVCGQQYATAGITGNINGQQYSVAGNTVKASGPYPTAVNNWQYYQQRPVIAGVQQQQYALSRYQQYTPRVSAAQSVSSLQQQPTAQSVSSLQQQPTAQNVSSVHLQPTATDSLTPGSGQTGANVQYSQQQPPQQPVYSTAPTYALASQQYSAAPRPHSYSQQYAALQQYASPSASVQQQYPGAVQATLQQYTGSPQTVQQYSYPRQPTHPLPAQTTHPLPAQPTHSHLAQPTHSHLAQAGQSSLRQPLQSQPAQSIQPYPAQPAQPYPAQPVQSHPAQPAQPYAAQPAQPHPAQPAQPYPAQPAHPHPAQPAQPYPAQPAQPHPAQPAQPAQSHPAQSAQPYPAQPTQPYPAQSAQPHPAQPAQPYPAQPSQPHPAQPAQPAQPHPAQSAQPYPAQPTQPYPAQSAQPHPAQPAQPYPAQPAQPHPAQPAQPAQPHPAQSTQPYPAQPTQPYPAQSAQPHPSQSAQPYPAQPAQPHPAQPAQPHFAEPAQSHPASFEIVVPGTPSLVPLQPSPAHTAKTSSLHTNDDPFNANSAVSSEASATRPDRQTLSTEPLEPTVQGPSQEQLDLERQRREKWRALAATGTPYSESDKLMTFTQDVERLDKFVASLTTKSLNGLTPLDVKWQDILDQQETDCRDLKISVARCYPMKNRRQDALPFDSSLVAVPLVRDDYINACRLPDLSEAAPPLLSTQLPLPATRADFWCAVWQQQAELVVCLLTPDEISGQEYWPSDRGVALQYGPLDLTLQSETAAAAGGPGCVERILTLAHRDSRLSRVVIQLQLSCRWSQLVNNPAPLVQYTGEVLQYYQQQRSAVRPVVVHCEDGVARSAVLCALTAAMYHVNCGLGLPELPSLVALMNTARRGALQDRHNLLLLYQTLLYYVQDLLMKRGILTKRVSFDEPPGQSRSHSRHPSEDFLSANKDVLELQNRLTSLSVTAGEKYTLRETAAVQPSSAATVSDNSDVNGAFTQSAANQDADPTVSANQKAAAAVSTNQRATPDQSDADIVGGNTSDCAPPVSSAHDPLNELDPLWSMRK